MHNPNCDLTPWARLETPYEFLHFIKISIRFWRSPSLTSFLYNMAPKQESHVKRLSCDQPGRQIENKINPWTTISVTHWWKWQKASWETHLKIYHEYFEFLLWPMSYLVTWGAGFMTDTAASHRGRCSTYSQLFVHVGRICVKFGNRIFTL